MIIKTYNPDTLEIIGELDVYESVNFTNKYNDVGKFTIKGKYQPNIKTLLAIGNIVSILPYAPASKFSYVGYVQTLEIDLEGADYTYTAAGETLLSYLGQRIIWNTINFKGYAQDFIYQAVNENAIAPVDEKRKIPNLKILNLDLNTKVVIEKQVSYKNLLSTICDVAKERHLGLTTGVDIKTHGGLKGLTFSIYEGKDRTAGSPEPLIFSRDYDNITDESYIVSDKKRANTALIGGEGEGADRIMETAGNGNEGLYRYEIFVDAKELRKDNLPDAEYREQLRQKAREKFVVSLETIDGTAILSDKFTETPLGDKVSIVDRQLDVAIDTRITEIQCIYDKTGQTIFITFQADR